MCEQWEIQESSGMSKLFLSKYDLLHLVTHENYSYVKHIVYFRSKKLIILLILIKRISKSVFRLRSNENDTNEYVKIK
jgi:hypothetical protein